MADPVSRETVEAFFAAFVSRDPKRIAPFLDDDVDWLITGPVDLFPYCGQRRGKKAALEVFERLVPEIMIITSVVPEHFLVDGDSAAAFSRVTGKHSQSGRTIAHRIAQFWQFRNDKVVVYRTLVDSFDVVEQVLGHSISLVPDAPSQSVAVDGDVVEI